MKKIKGILGYIWALLAIIIVFATFLGNDHFSRKLASATGITISPWCTGGEVVRTIDHGAYTTYIHRPVFDALIGEKREGFIQVNWEPYEGLPPVIQERIDYDNDKNNDFLVAMDTKTGDTALTIYHANVLSIEKPVRLKKGWTVRVILKK